MPARRKIGTARSSRRAAASSRRPPARPAPAKLFRSPREWLRWLERNHASASEIWLRLAKKNAGIKSISYAEAIEGALCYGWIDGQAKGVDESFWQQRFTRRGPRSIWSKINCAKAEALISRGAMQPSGLAAIESAKRDGRWAAAYEPPSRATVPEDFQAALEENPAAKEFFATLDGANRYAVLFRVHHAKKPETRRKRIAQFVAMLANREKIHP